MDTTNEIQDEQSKLWNGAAGHAWVDAEAALDQMFEPFLNLLVAEVTAAGARGHVLDIGCGTGGTTLALARLLGTHGRCTGIDMSEPMIAAARARTRREHTSAEFIRANAQTHAFAPATVDMFVSRFGVMFFDQPVRAFANLRAAARRGAPLRLVAWRSGAENPFMTTAERAAAPLLPEMPARQSGAPGQFAFADCQRVHDILAQSGWSAIEIRPIDVECRLPEHMLNGYLARFGPVGRALEGVADRMRAHVIETVRAAFDPYVHGADVRFRAACWLAAAEA